MGNSSNSRSKTLFCKGQFLRRTGAYKQGRGLRSQRSTSFRQQQELGIVLTQNSFIVKESLKNTPYKPALHTLGIKPFEVITNPDGRLAHLVTQIWEKLSRDGWVLNTIRGYRIYFHTTPRQPLQPPSEVQSGATSTRRTGSEDTSTERGNKQGGKVTKTLKLIAALGRELSFCMIIYIYDILMMAE